MPSASLMKISQPSQWELETQIIMDALTELGVGIHPSRKIIYSGIMS